MSEHHDRSPEEGAEVVADVFDRVESAAVVDRTILESVLAAVIARGHVLLEDVPGTGKTVTARVLAEALGLSFTRIQFTPDLLPSDVTGSNIYNEHDGEFEFSEGPVFTNVLLADEINRAPPKTQAALLEAMEERQVSVDGTTHDLPEPFFVIATQNPIEQGGTFRLPEAQRDRFSVKTSLGYPEVEGEMGLLERRSNRRSLAPTVEAVTEHETVLDLQELAEDVTVEEEVRRYIIDLARETRWDARTEIGVSPRGVQRVFETARARAVIEGREFVTPEDVKQLARPTMAHRVILTTEATVDGVEGTDVVGTALSRVDVPGVAPEDQPGGESDGRQDVPTGGQGAGSDRAGEPRRSGRGTNRAGTAPQADRQQNAPGGQRRQGGRSNQQPPGGGERQPPQSGPGSYRQDESPGRPNERGGNRDDRGQYDQRQPRDRHGRTDQRGNQPRNDQRRDAPRNDQQGAPGNGPRGGHSRQEQPRNDSPPPASEPTGQGQHTNRSTGTGSARRAGQPDSDRHDSGGIDRVDTGPNGDTVDTDRVDADDSRNDGGQADDSRDDNGT